MQIRVRTKAGPRDLEVISWESMEAMLENVSVCDLSVPDGTPCSAEVFGINEEGLAETKRKLHVLFTKIAGFANVRKGVPVGSRTKSADAGKGCRT